jgi:hypothetical protein
MKNFLPSYEQNEEIIKILSDIRGNTGTGEIYGIHWNKYTDEVTRVADSVGKVYTKVTEGNVTRVVSDFDELFPFAGMKRVNYDVNANEVLYEYGHEKYTDTPDVGVEVLVKMPKFYYKANRTSNGIMWLISAIKREGFNLYPAFIRNEIEKEYIFVSAYEGAIWDTANNEYVTFYDEGEGADGTQIIPNISDGIIRSVAGQQPSSNHTIVEGRTMCEQNNLTQYDILSHWALTLLQIVEYATLDTQSVFRGIVDFNSGSGNHAQNTGHTSVLGNQSGEVEVPAENGATGQATSKPYSYRGVENFIGNAWKWTDGWNANPAGDIGGIYIAEHDFVSDKFDEQYKRVGTMFTDASAYIGDVDFSVIDYGFIPSDGSGSSSTKFHDYLYTSTSTNRALRVGGFWTNSSFAGAFGWGAGTSGSRTRATVSRAVKL